MDTERYTAGQKGAVNETADWRDEPIRYADRKTDGQAHISPLLCQLVCVSSYVAQARTGTVEHGTVTSPRRVVTSQAQAATRYNQCLFRAFRNLFLYSCCENSIL